jgi:NADH-quinone oxidoreductase subunit G
LCPVGALTSRKYRFRARPWDLKHTPSICPSCALGCNVTLDTRRGELLRLVSRDNPAVDAGWLCDYGRFGTLDRLRASEPVRMPMVRRNGTLEECSWEEALSVAAQGLMRAEGNVAALAGNQATNEELYLLAKLFRTRLRSGDIVVSGASPAPTEVLGGAAIADLETADAIVLVDANPIARQPVLDLRIKKQVKRRLTPLVILSNEQTGLDYLAQAVAPFTTTAPQQTLEQLVSMLQSGEQTADDPLAAVARALAGARRGLVLYDERLLTLEQGSDLLAALHALAAALSGGADAPQRPLALAAAANSRGAAEMGAHGSWLAGGVPLSDTATAAKLGAAWGGKVALAAGRTASEIVAAARTGSLGALYLLQEDPVAIGGGDALQALEQVPFVVVQASRRSAALEYADVVLPAAPFGETAGTYTNTEGRVQRLAVASVPEEPVRPGWQILADLAAALGGLGTYLTAEDVTQEIARLTGLPSWASLLIQALEPVAAGGTR